MRNNSSRFYRLGLTLTAAKVSLAGHYSLWLFPNLLALGGRRRAIVSAGRIQSVMFVFNRWGRRTMIFYEILICRSEAARRYWDTRAAVRWRLPVGWTRDGPLSAARCHRNHKKCHVRNRAITWYNRQDYRRDENRENYYQSTPENNAGERQNYDGAD